MHLQIVNFGPDAMSLTISATGVQGSINALGSTVTVLTSGSVMDENSFANPNKVSHRSLLAFRSNVRQSVEPVALGYDMI